jgi:NAD(P)-dependent dehydrogenase (short-subunit alcohol dehydrogenase family)
VKRVQSAGVELAVREHGDPARPTILLVHGFPDTQGVWDDVVPLLAREHHVVTYDVRGAGASTAPARREGYDFSCLVDDLLAVASACAPGKRVHLVGHDWGSIQCWEAATTPRAAEQLRSFTSISGPSLDHVGHWWRARLETPGGLARLARQTLRSWYVGAFHLPGMGRATGLAFGKEGKNGIELYRRNFVRLRRPRPDPVAQVPVQLIVARDDPYVSPDLFIGIERWCPTLVRHDVISGHWVPKTHASLVARRVSEFVANVEEGRPVSSGPAGACTSLVLITGAGSGIGRATAFAFAERGARIVAVDQDRASLERTVELVGLMGAEGHAHVADVSDVNQMETLARDVLARHGVPDVVVNNAGIGVAGPFLATTAEEWQRIVGVNLMGVVHGCRLFGNALKDRGAGGHIVNVASAAAFLPSRALPVYATTKAAVLMLSECLRAELAPHGIGVSAICPGLVATNITRATRFAGSTDAEQARLRASATRLYGRRNYGPEGVANEIVAAVRDNRSVVPVTIEARLMRALGRFAPGFVREALARMDAVR